jgi:hypothetical protein
MCRQWFHRPTDQVVFAQYMYRLGCRSYLHYCTSCSVCSSTLLMVPLRCTHRLVTVRLWFSMPEHEGVLNTVGVQNTVKFRKPRRRTTPLSGVSVALTTQSNNIVNELGMQASCRPFRLLHWVPTVGRLEERLGPASPRVTHRTIRCIRTVCLLVILKHVIHITNGMAFLIYRLSEDILVQELCSL